ncbi:MAG: hypothetical protein HY347_09895 [candidate division NC10 bacterium]|nr:hypothetical protein [candidate division NC10 bacterium]
MRILFLTLDIGFGHQRAALAVEKALRHLTHGLETHFYNILDLLSPSLAEGLARFYLALVKEDADHPISLDSAPHRRYAVSRKRGVGRSKA